MENEHLIRQVNKSNYEIYEINRGRCQAIEVGMNQNGAIVFLGIGIHYDHVAKRAFPVVTGSDWLSREDAMKLLQDALTAMNTKIIEDAEKKI